VIRAYAANTNQGLVRTYNEDRVSIILNIMKPESKDCAQWPRCSFFGIFDGHGGSSCADFLRDRLHHFVVNEPSFPANPKEAIMQGFEKAESEWINKYAIASSGASEQIVDRSGSCAVVTIVIDDMCYVANVGDSRAILSGESGSRIFPLSRDHKPTDPHEQQRIIKAGG
jgi:protein phosphatase 2C family protein 2/3